MSNFGKRTLVLWYSTVNDYYDIDDVDGWRKNYADGKDYVMASEPFNVWMIERVSAAEEINAGKIARVDEKISAARELLETLKGERANLLALPGGAE